MQGFREQVEQRFRELRNRIVARLEELEGSGATFRRTAWQRQGGGGGEMSELRGELFEKGGCNFSAGAGDRYPGVPQGSVSEGDRTLGGRPPRAAEITGKALFAARACAGMHPPEPR